MSDIAATEGKNFREFLRQRVHNISTAAEDDIIAWADRYAATMAREKLKDVEGWLMSEKARPVGEFQHPTTLQLVSEAITALASPDGGTE